MVHGSWFVVHGACGAAASAVTGISLLQNMCSPISRNAVFCMRVVFAAAPRILVELEYALQYLFVLLAALATGNSLAKHKF
jgi:hypothetical protein